MKKTGVLTKRLVLFPGTDIFLLLLICFACCAQPTGQAEASTEPNSAESPETFSNIDVPTFDKMRAESPSYIVVDVRTPGETADGMVPGAIEIDYAGGEGFADKIKGMKQDQTYLIYCAAGGRSARASQIFIDNGFTHVYNLEGGYGAWSSAHQEK